MMKQEIKKVMTEALKKQGFNSKQVSVRAKNCTYSYSFDVTIHDLNIATKQIEDIVNRFEEVRYDQYNGEPLLGGNYYVFVERDGKTQWPIPSQDFMDAIDRVKQCNDGSGEVFNGYFLMNINGRIRISNSYNALDHFSREVWHEEPTKDIADWLNRAIIEHELNEKYLSAKKGMKIAG